MYISACMETTRESEEGDFIEATRIEEDEETQESKMYQVYKDFLKATEENFSVAQHWVDKKGGSTEDGINNFLKAEEKLIKCLRKKDQDNKDYILCQELECPVCLVEMVPPVKIWTCKSGHTLCQPCKRNPNIGQKCPTCRQEIIGRATSLEKIAAALFKKITGREPPLDLTDQNIDVLPDQPMRDSDFGNPNSILEMVFYPQEYRSEVGILDFDLDSEMRRFFNNLSLITDRS